MHLLPPCAPCGNIPPSQVWGARPILKNRRLPRASSQICPGHVSVISPYPTLRPGLFVYTRLLLYVGSERVSKSEASEQQLREAQCIGRSLGALGDVINALQRRSGHVPFRNSKLTAVLQDSLCDSSKVRERV